MSKHKDDLVQVSREEHFESVSFLVDGHRTKDIVVVKYGRRANSGLAEVLCFPFYLTLVGCAIALSVCATVRITALINTNQPTIVNHNSSNALPVSY